jgi:mannose-6-phosphate isomerase-like protein (cupin superfamily)
MNNETRMILIKVADELDSKGLPEADLIDEVLSEEGKKKGFVTDIETDTKDNTDFRRVLYTGKHLQLVLMSLKANEDIGSEVHKDVDQFFRVDDGSGTVVINTQEHPIKNGSAFVIPAGAEHNIIASEEGLKLYSLYGPPNHVDKTVHTTKDDAEKSEEKFDGQATE